MFHTLPHKVSSPDATAGVAYAAFIAAFNAVTEAAYPNANFVAASVAGDAAVAAVYAAARVH